MKGKLIFAFLLVFTVCASSVQAQGPPADECPDGLVPVTYVDGRTGDLKTRCMSPQVVGRWQGWFAGGQELCPGSADFVDAVVQFVACMDELYIRAPGFSICYADDNAFQDAAQCLLGWLDYSEEPVGQVFFGGRYIWDDEDGGYGVGFFDVNESCGYAPGDRGPWFGLTAEDIEEARACAAVSWALGLNAFGLDALNEFPDFEPPPAP